MLEIPDQITCPGAIPNRFGFPAFSAALATSQPGMKPGPLQDSRGLTESDGRVVAGIDVRCKVEWRDGVLLAKQ